MKTNLLMEYFWEQGMDPGDVAAALGMTPEELFLCLARHRSFTLGQIRRITGLLGLTGEEADLIF